MLRSHPLPLLEAAGDVSGFRSAEYGLHKRTLRRELGKIVRALQTGTMTPAEATDAFISVYSTATDSAYAIGIRKAGAEFGSRGRAWLSSEVDATAAYFRGFADDVAADSVRFPGGVSGRLRLYTDRLDGVRSRGWADGGIDSGTFWWWRLSDSGDICDSCIVLNMSSPFRDEPPTVPGLGGTECGSACLCSLIRTTRDFRESLTLRAVEDLVARARYLRAQGQHREAWSVAAKAIEAADVAGYDPSRLAEALFGDAGWRQHAVSAATLRG